MFDYNGYVIEYNLYKRSEYTVQFEGEDIWFDSEQEAKDFIDSLQEVLWLKR